MNVSLFKSASQVDAKNWIRECCEAGDGRVKAAQDGATEITRLVLRETGVARIVLPPKSVTKEDLDRHPDIKDPYIVYEMESASPAAVSLSFNAAPNSYEFELNRYMVSFSDISTREYCQNVKYLLVYRNDPRDLFVSNGLKDMQTLEDRQFFGGVDQIIGTTPNAPSPLTGEIQNIEITSPASAPRAWNREALTKAYQTLVNFKVPVGINVCNAATFTNFAAMDRTEAGGDLSQDMMREGTAALKNATVQGQKFVVSIKNDLFLNDTMYMLSEPGWIGKFRELQAPVLFVEKKADIIRCYARETIGMTIANVKTVAKVTFLQDVA